MAYSFIPKPPDGDLNGICAFSLQSGCAHTDIHFHDCMELIGVCTAQMEVFFRGKWHTLYENEVLCLPPDALHCTRSVQEENRRVVVGIPATFFSAHDTCSAPIVWREEESGGFILRDEVGKECLSRMLALRATEHTLSALLLCRARLYEICSLICAKASANGWLEDECAHPLARAILRIIDRADAPSPYDAARQLGISYGYLNRIVRESFHSTYKELYHRRRLETAKKMLLMSDLSITEIAMESGFGDTSYFIKIFRRISGETPLAYRKRLRT